MPSRADLCRTGGSPLYNAIRTHRENLWNGDCPICKAMPSADLRRWTDPSGAVDLFADTAPIHNWSILVLPRRSNLLASVDAYALGAEIQAAVKAWRGVFSVDPSLNVLIRSGEDVGHDHHVAVLFILEAVDLVRCARPAYPRLGNREPA